MHGARCLGRDDELGTLEVGKLADIVLWRLDDLDHAGIADPVAALVLGARPLAERCSSAGVTWSRRRAADRATSRRSPREVERGGLR